MTMRVRSRWGIASAVALVAGALLMWSGPLRAEITQDEIKCEAGASQAVGKFVFKKSQCIRSCQQDAYADNVAPTDCVAPYGGNTAGCVTSSEAKTQGLGKKKCALDCPECYTSGDCNADIDAKVAAAETHVESLAADAYCDDSGSGDGLMLAEHKCQNTVIKFVSFFYAKKSKCLSKCHKAEFKGKIPAGSCVAGAVTDPKTIECIDELEAKVTEKIDGKCEVSVNPSADKPECGLYATRTGADWVASEETVVDSNDPGLFCES